MAKRLAQWLRLVADWLDPPPSPVFDALATYARAYVTDADLMAPGTSGEYKRHIVFAQLQKACPDRTKRAIARAIEDAL